MVLVVMRRRCSSAAAVDASSTRFTRWPVLAEMKTMLAHSMGRSCRGSRKHEKRSATLRTCVSAHWMGRRGGHGIVAYKQGGE